MAITEAQREINKQRYKDAQKFLRPATAHHMHEVLAAVLAGFDANGDRFAPDWQVKDDQRQ
jgi:hypothetical protein